MKRMAGLMVVLLLLSGCSQSREIHKNLFAMDTYMELTAYGSSAESALEQAQQELLRLDAMLDRKGEGELARINQEGEGSVSAETAEILSAALQLAEKTEGAFDPTVGSLMDAWGFYNGQMRVPEKSELAQALEQVGYEKVSLKDNTVNTNGTLLDLGGIAKGYAGDRLCQILRQAGITSAILSLGGNVQTVGKKPDGSLWQVAVADPEQPKEYACSLAVEDQAVITSGGYQRRMIQSGREYHHILDPKTGQPADTGLLSVTVVGDCGMICDALSTALYVMGLEQGTAYWREQGGFEAIFITKDTLYYTPGLCPEQTGDRKTVCLK